MPTELFVQRHIMPEGTFRPYYVVLDQNPTLDNIASKLAPSLSGHISEYHLSQDVNLNWHLMPQQSYQHRYYSQREMNHQMHERLANVEAQLCQLHDKNRMMEDDARQLRDKNRMMEDDARQLQDKNRMMEVDIKVMMDERNIMLEFETFSRLGEVLHSHWRCRLSAHSLNSFKTQENYYLPQLFATWWITQCLNDLSTIIPPILATVSTWRSNTMDFGPQGQLSKAVSEAWDTISHLDRELMLHCWVKQWTIARTQNRLCHPGPSIEHARMVIATKLDGSLRECAKGWIDTSPDMFAGV